MNIQFFNRPFWNKFWPLITVLLILVAIGIWWRFSGPGAFDARTFKAYNSTLAAVLELRRNPDNFDAAIQAGIGYYNLSTFDKAEEYYLKATEIDPAVALPWNNLGNTYRELLRLEDAEAAYLKSIELQPDSPTSYLNLANLYNRWPVEDYDRHPRVLGLLLQALDATDRDINILRALADYYQNAGDTQRAEEYLSEVDAQSSGDVNPPEKA